MRLRLIVERYLPMVIAVLANAAVVGLLSLASFTVSSGQTESIAIDLQDFRTKDEAFAPPSGGNTVANQAALEQAVQQMMTAASQTHVVTDLSAITTMATSPVSFEVKTQPPAAPSTEALAAMSKANLEFTKAAMASTSPGTTEQGGIGQSSSTIGQGSGIGNGTINGVKVTKNPGSAQAAGNYGAGWDNTPGQDNLQDQKIVMLIDRSESMGNNAREEIISRIAGQNQTLGTSTFYYSLMTSRPSSKSQANAFGENGEQAYGLGPSPFVPPGQTKPADFLNAYGAIMDACEKYAGQNALLIVVSDFADQDSLMEEVPTLVDALLKAKLRLYLVRTDSAYPKKLYNRPNFPSPFVAAVMSGGGARYIETEDIPHEGAIPFENPYR